VDSAKHYTPAEEKANMLTHLLGIAIVAGGMALMFRPVLHSGARLLIGAAIFEFCLLAMYGASTLYHLTKDGARKQFCRRLDHSAIYLLIAGTYTPILLTAVPTALGGWALAVIWIAASVGIALKFFFPGRFHKLAVALYLVMGWLCVLLIRQMIAGMTPQALGFLIAGGIVYTAGVGFYLCRKPFAHAVWHLFVLTGSILHFYAVLNLA
jgi:channel protein, hemolysin III family